MPWVRRLLVALACLGFAAGAKATDASVTRPLVSVLTTCAALSQGNYPADTQNWFDANRNSQVIFYAYLLFPVSPLPDEIVASQAAEAWHPPMALVPPLSIVDGSQQGHYAQAEWLDPSGKRLALYGETLTAQPKSAWITVDGRAYMAQTVAMAIGTRDLRHAAGQSALPGSVGQYTVRLRVDGRSVGLSFFRILRTAPPLSAAPSSSSPAGSRSYKVQESPQPLPLTAPSPVSVPTLAPLNLP